MWVFYLISLPLTVGMVIFTLRYFAGPEVRRYVLFIVGYAWFCSLSIIILVPADIWTTIIGRQNGGIAFFWSWSYWSTFLLTWVVVPLIQGFEDAGDFTVTERLKTSIHANLMFYFAVGSVGLFGLFLLVMMRKDWSGSVLGLAMACSNTFGLVTGAFLLGFGLSEIPKSIWRNADWTTRQKVLSHKISKMAVKLDDAHQELSNAIVVAQATSKQVSKRDPLRPYMDVIDNMLVQMFRGDPSFKPQGGRLGENDMDYDADEKSMATLRRHLRVAREEYYRYKSEYMTYVMEALELEDTIKNYEHRSATGWTHVTWYPDMMKEHPDMLQKTTTVSRYKEGVSGYPSESTVVFGFVEGVSGYPSQLLMKTFCVNRFSGPSMSPSNLLWWKFISSLRPDRTGKLGPFFDTAELIWRCIIWKQLKKLLAIVLGCMSAAILLAEATLLPSVVNLSLFSILIKAVGKEEVLVQVSAFVPLMYMCVCTYYSLFKVGMLMFYSLTPRQTSSIKLLMICSMVARYAPPVSYNFLNLIRLDEETIFEKRMGNIDDAVPFFGRGFNKIYPLIMVIYTLLVVSNFFDRVINFFGNWKIFNFQTDADDMDGFDPSGVLILQKERTWIEQGHEVGEHVIPLARNFNSMSIDVESGSNSSMDRKDVEMKATTNTLRGEVKGSSSKPRHEVDRYSGSREAISNKYAAIREQSRQASKKAPAENISSTRVTLLEAGNSESGNTPASGLASKWASMKSGFQNFKANIEAKKFLPLRQLPHGKLVSRASSSESLDDIFQRLKRPAIERENSDDEDEESTEISSGSKR